MPAVPVSVIKTHNVKRQHISVTSAFLIEIVTFPAGVRGIVRRKAVTGFTGLPMMADQREPPVEVRIEIPGRLTVARPAIPEHFPLSMCRLHSDRSVAIAAAVDVWHLESNEVPVAIRTVEGSVDAEHHEGLIVMFEFGRHPRRFRMAPFTIKAELALMRLLVTGKAFSNGLVEFSPAMTIDTGRGLVYTLQRESRLRMVKIDRLF